MDYSAELTQLVIIAVVLGAAWFGVNIWTRRMKNRDPEAGGGGMGMFGGGGGAAGGSAADPGTAGGGLDGDIDDVSIPKSGPDRHKGRFQLTGRDAETAAKVLKRMLKQDPGFKGQGEGE